MLYRKGTTFHHPVIKASNFRSCRSFSGTEFLKHFLEGSLFTNVSRPTVKIKIGYHARRFYTGLSLTEYEELVVVAVAVKHSSRPFSSFTDAQTIGQQFHGSDIISDIVDEIGLTGIVIGEFP